ncbi:MAG: metal-dependent transcriptional regulator [Acidobacteriota bacterium]
MTHPMLAEHRIEELAEEIFSLAERHESDLERVVGGSKLGREVAGTVLQTMQEDGLVARHGDQVLLLAPGEVVARAVVRRHRLAEVLFLQVMELEEADSESTACQVEHILSAEVTDRICTFLGHPPGCPHGKSIPRGDCCAAFRRDASPLVQPLTDLAIGQPGRVVFITPALYRRLDRLQALGLRPGGTVRLKQSRPSIIVQAGETSVALDREVCREIFVRPIHT